MVADLRPQPRGVDHHLFHTRLLQRRQVPLQQRLALHRQQRLGGGVGQRAHALATAGGQQQRGYLVMGGGTRTHAATSFTAPRCSAWRSTVVGSNRASSASISARALPEWSAPKLHTYTYSVTARCSGQVCTHRWDSASKTVAVTPPGPCAVAGNSWNNCPTGCSPAACPASVQAPPRAAASSSQAGAQRQPWRSAVRCSPCMARTVVHCHRASGLQPANSGGRKPPR